MSVGRRLITSGNINLYTRDLCVNINGIEKNDCTEKQNYVGIRHGYTRCVCVYIKTLTLAHTHSFNKFYRCKKVFHFFSYFFFTYKILSNSMSYSWSQYTKPANHVTNEMTTKTKMRTTTQMFEILCGK